MSKHLRVAVVGAGPAGIYASDILVKSELPEGYDSVTVDILEADPTPFGLIRYGVAPDHPRIKEIVKALHRVMSQENVRFFGNVVFGKDLDLSDLHGLYDAVVFATGARRDRSLDIPGIDLEGSFGAADFVSWYDGHPEAPRDWDFDPNAESVAVLGVGNVALDVARILAKTADELLTTDIPDNVYRGLRKNATKDVHVFARRGPAQAKFSPMELRELNHSPNIDVIVHGEGFEFDEGSEQALRDHKAQKLVVDVLFRYLDDYMEDKLKGAAHRIHIHFLQNPVEILGEDGKVAALRTEVTEFDGTGNVRGTGQFVETPVQAVYRAVGYYSDALVGLPFDEAAGVVPNDGGRVLLDGTPVPRTYVTGWIKRGPVGLIGHTKSDAQETVRRLLEDAAASAEMGAAEGDVTRFLSERDIAYTTWDGWLALDHHERHLGGAARERVKVVPREDMVRIARAL
ncbi:MAG TPA: FAD-dependent oxidoreductase [Nocardioides sp.]|nr:FAD-dependent oxidoreductase [Nocardioides sp.]